MIIKRFINIQTYAKNLKPSSLKRAINTQSQQLDQLSRKSRLVVPIGIFLTLCIGGGALFNYKTISAQNKLTKLKDKLNSLEIVKQLESGELGNFEKSTTMFSEQAEKHMANESNLTQKTYRSLDKIPFPPLAYYNQQTGESYEIGYIGKALGDGHGNIHEGIIASLLDEAFARVAYQKFKTHYLFTANLSINYLSGLKQETFYLIQCKLIVNNKNYKAEIEAVVKEIGPDNLVAKAHSVFLVPKDKRHLISNNN